MRSQHERNLRKGEARLLIQEQLSLKLRRFIEANIPELTGKIDMTWRHWESAILALIARMLLSLTLHSTTRFQVLVGMQS